MIILSSRTSRGIVIELRPCFEPFPIKYFYISCLKMNKISIFRNIFIKFINSKIKLVALLYGCFPTKWEHRLSLLTHMNSVRKQNVPEQDIIWLF
jgi:hypothetical protein